MRCQLQTSIVACDLLSDCRTYPTRKCFRDTVAKLAGLSTRSAFTAVYTDAKHRIATLGIYQQRRRGEGRAKVPVGLALRIAEHSFRLEGPRKGPGQDSRRYCSSSIGNK